MPRSGSGREIGLVADLWRYPVKSFAGERVRRAFLGPFGLLGDRRYAVLDSDGVPLTARRARALLGFRARYSERAACEGAKVEDPDGLVREVDDPGLARDIGAAVGQEVHVVRSAAGLHDAAPLHMVTDSSLGALGGWLGSDVDHRRFRANVLVEATGPEPFHESGWLGLTLALGDAAIHVIAPTERCAVTTFDPDTLQRDTRVLAALAKRRENLFGVYARVLRPGWVAVGDSIRAT